MTNGSRTSAVTTNQEDDMMAISREELERRYLIAAYRAATKILKRRKRLQKAHSTTEYSMSSKTKRPTKGGSKTSATGKEPSGPASSAKMTTRLSKDGRKLLKNPPAPPKAVTNRRKKVVPVEEPEEYTAEELAEVGEAGEDSSADEKTEQQAEEDHDVEIVEAAPLPAKRKREEDEVPKDPKKPPIKRLKNPALIRKEKEELTKANFDTVEVAADERGKLETQQEEEQAKRNTFGILWERGDLSKPTVNFRDDPDWYCDPENWYVRRIIPKGKTGNKGVGARFEVGLWVDKADDRVKPIRIGIKTPRFIWNAPRQFLEEGKVYTPSEQASKPFTMSVPLDMLDEDENAMVDFLNLIPQVARYHLWDNLGVTQRTEIWQDVNPDSDQFWQDNFKSPVKYWDANTDLSVRFDKMRDKEQYIIYNFSLSNTIPQMTGPEYLQKMNGVCGTFTIPSFYIMTAKPNIKFGQFEEQVIAGCSLNATVITVYSEAVTKEIGKRVSGGSASAIDYKETGKNWQALSGVMTPDMLLKEKDKKEKGKEKV